MNDRDTPRRDLSAMRFADVLCEIMDRQDPDTGRKNWTYAALAAAGQFSADALRNWRRGDALPTSENFASLRRALESHQRSAWEREAIAALVSAYHTQSLDRSEELPPEDRRAPSPASVEMGGERAPEPPAPTQVVSQPGPAKAERRSARTPAPLIWRRAALGAGVAGLAVLGLAFAWGPWRTPPAATTPAAPDMVLLSDGCFGFGSPEGETGRDPDEPVSQERCVDAFAIGRTELTRAEFDRFARATGRSVADRPPDTDALPAVGITWDDALAYAAWLSQETGRRFRLPLETEWEYAARGGAQTAYWWGAEPDAARAVCGVCQSGGASGPAPVASLDANAFGLHDTAGNVWEWAYPASGDAPVLRGGAFDSSMTALRSANRGAAATPQVPDPAIGFRLAETP